MAQAGWLGGAEQRDKDHLLTGSQGAAAAARRLLEAARVSAGIVIGTHACLRTLQFADLGLVVIDEQHNSASRSATRCANKAGDGVRTCWS